MALAARPRRGIGSWPLIVVGAVITVAGALLTWNSAPCSDFHVGTQYSGSDRNLARWIGGCPADLGAARATLGWDTLFLIGYALTMAGIVRRWWPLFQARRLKEREIVAIAIPFVVAGLDLIENVATLLALGTSAEMGGRRFTFPDNYWLPTVVSTAAWLKTFGFVVALALVAMAIGVGIACRHEPDEPRVVVGPPRPIAASLDGGGGFGVACSGGGVRAAAFALGALDELERAGVMDRARYLTAVSGGNYAATAWTLARAADKERPAAADVIAWLESPIPNSKSGRHRFLLNGPGGLGRAMIAAVGYIAVNLVVLSALVVLAAWPIGRIVGSRANQPVFRTFRRVPRRLEVPIEMWLPSFALLGLAVAILLISALPTWSTSWLWRVSRVLAFAAFGLAALLVGVPRAMVAVNNWLDPAESPGRAAAVGFTALAGALGVAWRLLRQPVLSRITASLPKLGGVLLVVVALVWAGKVATDAATDHGMFGSAASWWIVAVLFVGIYAFVGATQPSIHRIYRRRLLRTFGVTRRSDGTVHSPGVAKHREWHELPEDGPELVVCCAQQRNGIAPGGLPADTFTISRAEVRIGDTVVPTAEYLAHLPPDLAGERSVGAWMATSGAAFASAMGRLSKGSTNALMAALNIDLGIWLPNPRLVGAPNMRFPKVRFGYLFKEILGWYDEADRYVFVADGGHWENLGLVELLRRRCSLIVCLDASGDAVGGFATLREAVELAGLELAGVVERIDLDGLQAITGVDGAMAATSITTLTVEYVGGARGTVVYAKAQLASDLDVGLRRYAKADPTFPSYSTANQFLRNEQFHELVALGQSAGRGVVRVLDAD